jgi:hypothetical protein
MTDDAPNLYDTDPRIDAEIRALQIRIAQAADSLGLGFCGFAVVWALSDDEEMFSSGQMRFVPGDFETIEALTSLISGGQGVTETETPPPSTPLRLT